MEWTSFSGSAEAAVYQSECSQLNVTGQTTVFNSSRRCDLTGAVAGCQNTGNKPLITSWFYAPDYTLGAVQAACREMVITP